MFLQVTVSVQIFTFVKIESIQRTRALLELNFDALEKLNILTLPWKSCEIILFSSYQLFDTFERKEHAKLVKNTNFVNIEIAQA